MTEDKFKQYLPLVAILRGITPSEILPICEVLIKSKIGFIEVPLNSPSAFESIGLMVKEFGSVASVGAGTVITMDAVTKLSDLGARIVVSPNTNPEIISRTLELNMLPMPGVYSPTDAFAAAQAGAKYLKLFPARNMGAKYISDIKSVLPKGTELLAVGGIDSENAVQWIDRGAKALGLGSSLYKPGHTPLDVKKNAEKFIKAFTDKH